MIRLFLRESVSRDVIDDASFALGLQLLNIVPATAAHPAQHIYTARDRATRVHLIEDERLGAPCFVIMGPAEEACASALSAALPLVSPEPSA